MKRLVEFPSDSGEPILMEVEDVAFGGETRRWLAIPSRLSKNKGAHDAAYEPPH